MNTKVKILAATFLFWIAENCYFGWNQRPQSACEAFCDMVIIFLMILSVIWEEKNPSITHHVSDEKFDKIKEILEEKN